MTFATDLAKYRAEALAEADRKTRAVALQVFGAVMEATPVDEGRLRGNWMVSIDTPSNATTDEVENIKNGAPVSQKETLKINNEVAKFSLGASIHLTNNMPYARRIEYEGWSNQAPAGMLRVTVERAKPDLRKLGFEVQ